MNVLESLKIKDATILNVKDGDILIFKLKDKNTSREQLHYISDSMHETFKRKGIKNVEIILTTNVSDIKIIRR